jgi:hypothetical protein
VNLGKHPTTPKELRGHIDGIAARIRGTAAVLQILQKAGQEGLQCGRWGPLLKSLIEVLSSEMTLCRP